jgi:hypothetical protein
MVIFSLVNWRQSATEAVKTSNELLAFDTQIQYGVKEKVYPDFFYDVDSRFMMTITKEALNKARSIRDFIPKDMTEPVVSYKSVSVVIFENNRQTAIHETGNSEVLTAAQIKLLRSFDYSTNFLIRADFFEKNTENGELKDNYFSPHMTIVPETQAVYIKGKSALIEYLKENSKVKTTIVEKKKLQPGKVFFTVTKKGTISNVGLLSTSGYPSIDDTMIELITKAPGKWEPAENSKGEKVDQELVFSFGLAGC